MKKKNTWMFYNDQEKAAYSIPRFHKFFLFMALPVRQVADMPPWETSVFEAGSEQLHPFYEVLLTLVS